jgi:hypothetical protein
VEADLLPIVLFGGMTVSFCFIGQKTPENH